MVLGACDAFDWCFDDAKDWCPDVIDMDLTRIASQVKNDVTAGLDYSNINNLTLVSTILTVHARSARTAISVAQRHLKSNPLTCPADHVTDLEKIRWLMAQQEGPIDYDANEFDEFIADQDGEALEKRDGGICKGDVVLCDNVPWFRRILEGIRKFLSKLKNKMFRSAVEPTEPLIPEEAPATPGEDPFSPEGEPRMGGDDPLNPGELEEAKYSLDKWQAKEGYEAAKQWANEAADAFEPVPEDVLPPHIGPDNSIFPPDFAEGVPPGEIPFTSERPGTPPPPGPPGANPRPPIPPTPADQEDLPPPDSPPEAPPPELPPPELPPPELPPPAAPPPSVPELPAPPIGQEAEPIGLFRAELFDSVTGTLKQLTVRPGIITEKQALTMNGVWDEGLRPYHIVDSAGDPMKMTWLKPSDFVSTPGQWAVRGEQFVREQFNNVAGSAEPVLNSLGEPLVASAQGTFMTLAPVALRPAGIGVHGVLECAAHGVGSAIGSIFDMFRPESGSPTGSVLWNPEERTLDFLKPSGSLEGNPDDYSEHDSEYDSEHFETHEPEDHDNGWETETEDSEDPEDFDNYEDNDGEYDEGEGTQTAETTAPKTTAPETTPTPPDKPIQSPTEQLSHATSATPPAAPAPEETWITEAPDATTTETKHATATSNIGTPKTGAQATATAETHLSTTAWPTNAPSTPDLEPTKTTEAPNLSTNVHETSQATETQHQPTSSPYPYPNSHLPVTFPSPTTAHDTTKAVETHTSNIYPYPDNHPDPTSTQETDAQTTSNILPFPNSHIPKTFPAPTMAHDATEAMKTQTKTWSNMYPYPENHHDQAQTTSNIYPYPDNHTPTTLATVTGSNTQKTSIATGAWPSATTITGCKSNKDCPVCNAETSCQIGDLPPECVRNALNIDNMSIAGNYTWVECVGEIWELDREEAKAWANAITLPYCISEDEWEPREMDSEHGGECWFDIEGEDFATVGESYITALLPLKCPSYRDMKDGKWDGYDDDLKDDCKKVGEVLSKPFRGKVKGF